MVDQLVSTLRFYVGYLVFSWDSHHGSRVSHHVHVEFLYTVHVSSPYNIVASTVALYTLHFTRIDTCRLFHSLYLKFLNTALALPILRDSSSSSLALSETVLPRYLKDLHLTSGSVPMLISSGSDVDNWNFDGWLRHSVFLMLILRQNWGAALANFSTKDCISSALCATRAISSAKTISLTIFNEVLLLALNCTTLNKSASFLDMGLINKVDMVCLSPVGYGV